MTEPERKQYYSLFSMRYYERLVLWAYKHREITERTASKLLHLRLPEFREMFETRCPGGQEE